MAYEYAYFRTLAAAVAALEDMLASGEVSPGERPTIIGGHSSYIIILEA